MERLCFSITNYPSWRSDKSSSVMVKEIIHEYKKMSEAHSSCYHQDKWFYYAQRHAKKGQDKRCHDVSEAMKVMSEYRGNMKENNYIIRLLTVPMICEIHQLLVKDGGQFRTRDAYTDRPNNSCFYYMSPQYFDIEDWMYRVVDVHNLHMQYYYEEMKSKTTEDKYIYIIKSAAWFFCRVISIHPFSNGNGRLCRLLANDVLMELNRGPIQLFNVGNVTKTHYFNAIIQCQDPERYFIQPPEDFAALLVDGIWYANIPGTM